MNGRHLVGSRLIAIGLLVIGIGVGGALGSWLPPLAVASWGGHGGIASIPRSAFVFAEPPDWLRSENHSLFSSIKLCSAVFALAGAAAAMALAQRLWRYLMVRKLGWMTDKEVDEFWKRDPGF